MNYTSSCIGLFYGGREGSAASREKSRLPPLKCRLPRTRQAAFCIAARAASGNAKCRAWVLANLRTGLDQCLASCIGI